MNAQDYADLRDLAVGCGVLLGLMAAIGVAGVLVLWLTRIVKKLMKEWDL